VSESQTTSQPTIQGFHHVALRVADFDRSVAFYCELLDFTMKVQWGEAPQRIAMLETADGNYLELFERPSQPKATEEGQFFHLCFRTDQLDAMVERVRAGGAKITVEPKDLDLDSTPFRYTPRLTFFEGPDGEVIEFLQNDQT